MLFVYYNSNCKGRLAQLLKSSEATNQASCQIQHLSFMWGVFVVKEDEE